MIKDIDNQWLIVDKAIIDVESKVQLAEFTNVLKETNDLLKELNSAVKMEEIQEIADDIKEREQMTKEFNRLFDEYHIQDKDINEMFAQYEAEVNGIDFTESKMTKDVKKRQFD